MATSPQEVDLVPGDEHTVSERSKTPGIGGATTSSDTAIVDPAVTALVELQQMRGLHRSTFQALARLENGNFLSLRQGANGYCLVARKIHNNTERPHIHRSGILLAGHRRGCGFVSNRECRRMTGCQA
jgi:hypothetical protein